MAASSSALPESERDKKEGKDKGLPIPKDLYQFLVDPAVFDNIAIDEYSLELLKKGKKEKFYEGQRYAVVGFLEEKGGMTLYFSPSFKRGEDENELKKKQRIEAQVERKNFDEFDIVEAPPLVPGVVHRATMNSIYYRLSQEEITQFKAKKVIGLSFFRISNHVLDWTSRSTENYSVAEIK